MAEQAEQAFAKTFLNTLSTQPITYRDDYQQPLQNSLRKIPVLPIPVPPAPERKQPEASTSSSAPISLVFKSLKPPKSYTIAVQATDSIAAIKAQLAAESGAPPADAQRLLLKGKALADGKLLKEYNVQDGASVNLMIKPGFDWDPTKPSAIASSPASMSSPEQLKSPSPSSLEPSPSSKPSHRKHQRIPSVVLSPSPTEGSPGPEKDIMLTLDTGNIPDVTLQPDTLSTYHTTVANPDFWERLNAFLKTEFLTENDSLQAFEDFLCASKGSLTASEIAKIRDHVGVMGMAGT